MSGAVGHKRVSKDFIEDCKIPLPTVSVQQSVVAILDEAFVGLATAISNVEQNLRNARELFESYLNSIFGGDAARDWKTKALFELVESDTPITYGVVKPGPEGDVTFVRGGDLSSGEVLVDQLRTITRTVSDQYKRTLLRGGELLICLVGQPGQVGIVPPMLKGANIARQVGLIRLRPDSDTKFISYFLRSPIGQKYLGAYQGGSVQQVINLADLRLLDVPVPELSQQEAIVKKIDEVSEHAHSSFKNYRRKVGRLAELKQSILRKAFSGELTSPPTHVVERGGRVNEAETRAELIDPALRSAGWGVVTDSRTRREEICPGRIEGAGRRGKKEIADYVLTFRNHKLAVIEAKAEDKGPTEGVAQAKAYAEKLQARFAFSTNGRRIYRIDMESGKEGYVERYPTPDELWAEVFKTPNEWRDRFAAVPFEEHGGKWETRYYRINAVQNALEAVAKGKKRILLTLATGTGKTAIAFQIAWALFQSSWNLSRKPDRRPRILFLADRNILANQAYHSFMAFPDDALARIKPDEIRKKGRVPKNASVFFTIFQTFMSGTGPNGQPAPYFGDYPKDFFDFIVVDECHRGGANDEGNWRGILDYFSPAVQLGLTATPKRRDNVDTYKYFGDPVYSYSLKDGINDGFLTPFKVKQIATTIDDYLYTL